MEQGDPVDVDQFYTGSIDSGLLDAATFILNDLNDHLHGAAGLGEFRSCYSYRPDDSLDQGQGLLGDGVIPEPSTFLLMGGGLLASIGIAWRRRMRG